jgi:hypothetical protein
VWLVVVGCVDAGALVVLARVFRVRELTTVVDLVARRLPLPRRA